MDQTQVLQLRNVFSAFLAVAYIHYIKHKKIKGKDCSYYYVTTTAYYQLIFAYHH